MTFVRYGAAVSDRAKERMQHYWDQRAAENAVFYVDTTTDYEHPDMEQFLAAGRAIASEALAGPVSPAGRGLAVEIGPGLGRVCLAMAEHFDRVVGVDVSAEMVRQARELVTDPRITFELGDGASLGAVGDATADFVYEFTVFQHIPSVPVIETYIGEVARVLRSGGVASLQWNNQANATRWRIRRTVVNALRRMGVRRWSDTRFSPEFLGQTVSTARMTAALEHNGLEVAGVKGEGTLFAWVWARKP